ncbi:hypothetical protein [Streptomyces sp. NPDC057702]|uniref:SCO2584 family spore wall biosynthesis protein n=1 Tax=unclassified Streptomyces TaxID=2593676 RepID=UPI003681B0B3
MPDDVGGKPFPDGDEPDDHHHGAAEPSSSSPPASEEGEFASVVFDEDFVRSAEVHEPSAVERMLAAAQARAEAEATRTRHRRGAADDDPHDEGYGPDGEFGYDPHEDDRYGYGRPGEDPESDDAFGPYGRYGDAGRPYRGHAHWQRPVAWVLAVLMGIGVVAMAFTAVYRGASGGGNRQDPTPPPASSEVDSAPGAPADAPFSATLEAVEPAGLAEPDAAPDPREPVASAVTPAATAPRSP